MATAKGKDPILDNLSWSDIEYTLFEFVDRFPLPQIVRVTEGYYGPTEDSCIGAEQILTLHCVKTTDKVLARDRRKRELTIPLNCSQKVELRPQDFRGISETVEEINNIPIKFVRVTQGYYSLNDDSVCVNPGDKLEVINVEYGLGGKEDCVLFHNEERTPIRLPLSVSAGFQALLDGREYYLKEVVSSSPKLPLYFQFTDPPSITKRSSEHVFNTSLGVLSLEKVYQDATVICTTKEGDLRTVVSCPKHLPIRINVAQGALTDDKDYVRICRIFHDGVSLGKIENMEIQNIYASRDTIREYEYVKDVLPPPPRPARGSTSSEKALPQTDQVPTTDGLETSDSDDSNHEYTYIEDWSARSTGTTELKGGDCAPLTSGGNPQGTHLNENPEKNTGNDDYVYLPVAVNPGPESVDTVAHIQEPVAPPRKAKSEANKMSDPNPQGIPKKGPPPPIKPKPATKRTQSVTQPKEEEFKVPDDLSQLTVREVSDLLRHFHFGEFVEVFAENLVDGGLLVSLDEEDLKSLGMNSFHCKKIKKIIFDGWRPKE